MLSLVVLPAVCFPALAVTPVPHPCSLVPGGTGTEIPDRGLGQWSVNFFLEPSRMGSRNVKSSMLECITGFIHDICGKSVNGIKKMNLLLIY